MLARLQSAASRRWAGLKERHPGLRHIVAAWKLLQDNNGNQYAAAITYFSFLALFPLLLLAVAITGFVLHSHPAAQQSLFDHITANVPGDLGQTVSSSIRTAIGRGPVSGSSACSACCSPGSAGWAICERRSTRCGAANRPAVTSCSPS